MFEIKDIMKLEILEINKPMKFKNLWNSKIY